MDESQRYNEPKKLGDIIPDIHLDWHHLEHTKKIHYDSKDFAEKILENLQKYTRIVDDLDFYYKDASKNILNIDRYHTQEKIFLSRATLSIKAWHMTQKDINARICAIQKDLDEFDTQHTAVNNVLRYFTSRFACEDDTLEYDEKTNAYCSLFMDIYCDLDDICEAYSNLLSLAKPK